MIDLWVKALVRFPVNIGRAKNYLLDKQSRIDAPVTGRPIILDVRTPRLLFDSGRHLTCLAHSARIAGSPTLLRCSRLLLAEISRKQFGEAVLSDPNVRWLPLGSAIPADGLVLYDCPRKPADIAASSPAMRMMIGRDVISDAPVMPYPMHPSTLSTLGQFDLESLRSAPRLFDLFFAGTQTLRYGYSRIEQGFGVQSRIALLETVRSNRRHRVLSSPEAASSDSIVLLDSHCHAIKSEDWLPTLAKTDFFLCCPGAAQPMCHNVIEAMSVGAIPVIEYGDRLFPSLIDGVNAICFRGCDGLKEALDRMDQMSVEQRATLRQNVVEYYENYLRGDQFLAGLLDGVITSDSGMISMPFNDKNLFPANGSVSHAA